MAMAAKKRKYNDNYLELGFTSITIGGIQKPQCVICHKVLTADSMRPNKLKAHLESVHPTYVHKDLRSLQHLERSLKAARFDSTGIFQQQNEAALAASYEISQTIAKAKKPHTIGETLIAPCVEIIVKRMLGEDHSKKVAQVSLSNTTIQRRILHLDEDIEDQVVAAINKSPVFAIQLDESTDVESLSQLISYVRYIDHDNMKTEFLFCKPLKTTARADDIFDIINIYFQSHNIDWKKLVFCTTDGAPAMMGKKTGVITRAKNMSPDMIGNHCWLHRQVLSSKAMPEELSAVFNKVTETINAIKSSATNSRLFTQLCQDNEAEYERLLYFTAVRWLSRGKAVLRVFEFRSEIADFLDYKGHRLGYCFKDSDFVAKVAYLTDIFSALNTINKSLQGRNITMFEVSDKLTAFFEKLKLWQRRVDRGQLEHFQHLQHYLESEKLECTFRYLISEHIEILKTHLIILNYFDDDFEMFKIKQWVQFPFVQSTADHIDDDQFSLKEEYISLRADSSLKIEFDQVPLAEFWIARLGEYPLLAKEAVKLLVGFPTSWECEVAK